MKSLMEQLSENPLQIALVENKELKEQLAKANERVEELEGEILESYEYETEYDGRIYSFCIHCGEDMDSTVHHESCIVRQLRKEQD